MPAGHRHPEGRTAEVGHAGQPTNASPAPLVSTTSSTRSAGTWTVSSAVIAVAPAAPCVTTTSAVPRPTCSRIQGNGSRIPSSFRKSTSPAAIHSSWKGFSPS